MKWLGKLAKKSEAAVLLLVVSAFALAGFIVLTVAWFILTFVRWL